MGWVWSGLGWVLLAGGLAVLAWALLWDRAGWRGRAALRCRGCWYDLTGAVGGAQGERPAGSRPHHEVVCPECGKGHRSRRSMRRTRRRWWGATLAVVLLVGAHGAWVAPEVQKRGWGAAVPRTAIVLSIPFLSKEQGSGLADYVLPARSSNATDFDRFVLGQIPSSDGSYFVFASGRSETEFGWLSRRLVFLIARFQDRDVVTDGTTARGAAMKRLISNFVSTERCYGFEADWAKRQVTIDIDIRHDFGPAETPIGVVRMRRLLLGPYRVRFGDDGTMHRGGSPTSWRINGFQPLQSTAEEERAHWVGRFLWDDLGPVDRSWGDRRAANIPGVLLSKGTDQGDGTSLADVVFTFYEYAGDGWGGIMNDASWKTDQVIRRQIRYRLDPNRTIVADSTQAFAKEIVASFSAKLGVEYEQGRDRWIPVVTLTPRSGASPFKADIVFGGDLVLAALDPGKVGDRGTEYMRGSGSTFWAWGRERYSEPAPITSGVAADHRRTSGAERALRVRNRFDAHLPGEMTGNHWSIKQRDPSERDIVLRMRYQHHPHSIGFGGLWGERVYEGVLEFDIPDWTIDDLRQLIVNGIVPKHAMP